MVRSTRTGFLLPENNVLGEASGERLFSSAHITERERPEKLQTHKFCIIIELDGRIKEV
jgi:hypothetical protein